MKCPVTAGLIRVNNVNQAFVTFFIYLTSGRDTVFEKEEYFVDEDYYSISIPQYIWKAGGRGRSDNTSRGESIIMTIASY
jgi:hypothetical protein